MRSSFTERITLMLLLGLLLPPEVTCMPLADISSEELVVEGLSSIESGDALLLPPPLLVLLLALPLLCGGVGVALLLEGVRLSALSAAAISVLIGGDVLTGAGGVIMLLAVDDADMLHDE